MDLKLKRNLTTKFYADENLLFHYTSLDSCKNILINNTLRFSNLENVNDPLEFCVPKTPLSFLGEVRRFYG